LIGKILEKLKKKKLLTNLKKIQMTRIVLREIQKNLNNYKEVKELDIDSVENLCDLLNKDLEDLLNYGVEQVSLMIDNTIKTVRDDKELEQMFNYNKTIRQTMKII
jgi:3-dehydroquinate dehydratase